MRSIYMILYVCLIGLCPNPAYASNYTASLVNSTVPKATYFATSIFTVDEGTLLFEAAEGTSYSVVTLTGPTTATIIASQTVQPPDASAAEQAAPWINHDDPFVAYDNPADPGCRSSTGNYSLLTSATVVRKLPVFTLTAGQTTTSLFYDGPYGETMVNKTFTGPSTVYSTTTAYLLEGYIGSPEFQGVIRPAGERCGARCGTCGLFFEVVYVYYWPVASANTGCLSSSNITATTLVAVNTSSSQAIVHPRGLSQLTGVTTLVNSEGFTFTSPSVYIGFPTIFAADECGYIGSIHTSVTRAVAPDQLSTAVIFSDLVTTYFPFNYADAQCPPSSLNSLTAWTVLGQGGNYNPIISPPADLTLIDPAWNQLCEAEPFQGNDPPYALVPQANLSPFTTLPNDPLTTATPASPISEISALPVSTPTSEFPGALLSQTATIRSAASNTPAAASSLSSDLAQDPGNSAIPASQNIQTVHIPSGSVGPTDPSIQITADPDSPEAATSKSTMLPPTFQITVDGQTITVNSASNFIVAGQTLTYGEIATAAAYSISIPSIPTPLSVPAIITIAGQTYTADSMSDFLIAGQTLAPSGVVTVLGTPLSLAPDASFIVIAGTALPLNSAPESPNTTTLNTVLAEVLTFGSRTYTADRSSAFNINGETLVPGSAITISGTKISLDIVPTDVVIGSTTEGLGAIILSGFGAAGPGGQATTFPTAAAAASINIFEGSAANIKSSKRWGKASEEIWPRIWELGMVAGTISWMLL